MPTNDEQIRALIESWAEAVHLGDLETVAAEHAEDIVMYDVPENVHGIEAYRKAWPPFFTWQADGAVFEIESLDVTAGEDVAFAHALLRCGMPEDVARNRMRLTLGLRKEGGRWVVAHEHHSFPLTDDGTFVEEGEGNGEREVRRSGAW
ncbi:nuclear transport factor 2 family protein [Nonomuraea purpurea]|uniref:Nuclear transport factor 2 family protein n=1 Tax=Nonomuraea purpurea TaxID=1849276 RepID=A0ABV8GPP8_9ACTN